MELLDNLTLGLHIAMSWQNLQYAFAGALLGTLVGVLPGLGPVAALAMLMPFVYFLDATPALVMLAGIYYGAQYGGSISAILLNVQGESSSVVTATDGHQMARQGRAGAALAVAGLGSFFAGCVATVFIVTLSRPLVVLASSFGPAEYFSLMVLGLVGAVVLTSGSLVKAIAMIVLGLLLGQVNTDALSGTPRFTMGIAELRGGIGFVAIAMGLFVLGEIIAHLGQAEAEREVLTASMNELRPTRQDFQEAWPSVLRGTALGAVLGVVPGGGALLASFASYTLEKKVVKRPRVPFGKGAIQGVAGPESANNAGAQTSFIPMLALGIPPNAVMALMIGAMTLKGIQPGPQVMTSNPGLFWGLVVSMWVGNLMLVVLNLPLIRIWSKVLTVPYRLLFPVLVVICCIASYALKGDSFDVYMTAVFALIGYMFYKLNCEPAPLLLGFIMAPMMEDNLRRVLLSEGDWSTFLSRPLSAGLLIAAMVMVIVVLLPRTTSDRDGKIQVD
ncbi:tripartite tricarboxylate transporter permease [Roseateles koreensis]|uniref:Tripartite tricarboxylate transporter permease n=1 Tax=Roseateles koreensis TaxID=2987526 RepID=A0ABT5KWG1_9BURK|nr:tripartite tricarboxylate transporter permease [Roseateles koreensis]MDC8787279.1 tripartite tricarboxylate transporter permease [Roseateles koreensis]